ncbi:glycosyltransferase family 4 protein [Nocardioides sp. URHA0020]|uniref:glycosyltransferase family 4 protein n=1 Tax=Nocardioides sp. URHA0020 TaxID=1380392 RepID=UPI0006856B40|nr:glycosyltransferase family 4 protein [Nocardioides sp. URHA0020]
MSTATTGQRIVQVTTQTVGGPVEHAVDVAIGLAARGHDSHVVGPRTSRTEEASGAGVTWHDVPMVSKRDLRGGLASARLLRALRPDVVHLQDRRAGWLGRAIAPVLRGREGSTGVVYTLHGVADGLSDLVAGNARAAQRRRRDGWYYLTGERAITRWGGGRVVVPSRAVAAYAVDHVGLRPEIVDVVPNGVAAAHHEAPRVATGDPVAIWVGVLAPVKRVDLLLDAVAAAPGLRLLVAGDGPLRDEVGRRAAEPDLAGRVELAGWVDDPSGLLARADVYVLTSDAENCPLSLLEAMAAGLPVVATTVGGVPEVVRDGVDGLLCPAGDAAALAAALRRLSADPHLRARLGASARQRVLDSYTLDHCLDGLLASYAASRGGA